MKKRFSNFFVLSIFGLLLLLGGCTSNEGILPDLTGKSRTQIESLMKQRNITFQFYFVKEVIDESKLDQFVSYGNNLKAYDKVTPGTAVSVYTTVLPLLPSSHTVTFPDELEVDGKNFLEDGVGIVRLSRAIDGDTADFTQNGETFRVRFLGVDTPEISSGGEPWGRATADYTKAKLQNAKEIILVSEGVRVDGYGRQLAFVWVDGLLLNLDLVHQAYSYGQISSSSIYFQVFALSEFEAKKTGRRIHGELDPSKQ